MQILSNPISALNVCKSPKFSRLLWNRGRGTRWWRQILDHKWNIMDVAMGQIPRSTERISSFFIDPQKWYLFPLSPPSKSASDRLSNVLCKFSCKNIDFHYGITPWCDVFLTHSYWDFYYIVTATVTFSSECMAESSPATSACFHSGAPPPLFFPETSCGR